MEQRGPSVEDLEQLIYQKIEERTKRASDQYREGMWTLRVGPVMVDQGSPSSVACCPGPCALAFPQRISSLGALVAEFRKTNSCGSCKPWAST